MATDAEKIVTEFCNAWPRKNIDELLGFFTDDAVYHNIPMEPPKGKDAIRARHQHLPADGQVAAFQRS